MEKEIPEFKDDACLTIKKPDGDEVNKSCLHIGLNYLSTIIYT